MGVPLSRVTAADFGDRVAPCRLEAAVRIKVTGLGRLWSSTPERKT